MFLSTPTALNALIVVRESFVHQTTLQFTMSSLAPIQRKRGHCPSLVAAAIHDQFIDFSVSFYSVGGDVAKTYFNCWVGLTKLIISTTISFNSY